MRYSAAKVRIKKKVCLEMSMAALMFVMLCAGNLHAQQSKPLSLNNAIAQSARSIEQRLDAGTRVAILVFSSGSEKVSDYIIDKLSNDLANDDSPIGYWWFTLGTNNMGIAEGEDYDKKTRAYKYGLWIDDFYLSAELDLSMGLSFWLSPYFFISANDYHVDSYFEKLRVEMRYVLDNVPVNVGLRGDFPIGIEVNKTTMEYQGISFIPYVRARFGGVNVTVNFYVYHMRANPDYNEVSIMPEIGIFYSFHL